MSTADDLTWMGEVLDRLSDEALRDVLRVDQFFISRRSGKEVTEHCQLAYHQLLRALPADFMGRVPVICVQSMDRPDYNELFSDIRQATCGSHVHLFRPSLPMGGEVAPERIGQISSLSEDLVHRLGADSDLERRYYLALRMMIHLMNVRPVLNAEPLTALFFASMQPTESLLCHWYNQGGTRTVTAQHGLYLEYRDIDTLNVINYEVQPAQHFLAWGEETASLISGYHPDVVTHVCGKPRLGTGIDPSVTVANDAASLHVVMDQEAFREQNLKLLAVLEEAMRAETKLKVSVRFHPHNNVPSYLSMFPWIRPVEPGEVAATYVGITSSLLHELETAGRQVLQFVSELPCHRISASRLFRNSRELLECIGNSEGKASNGRRLIECAGLESLERYERAWKKIVGPMGSSQGARPLLSIIVPVFNGQMDLLNLWRSVRNQSLRDFELLFCDGGSSDQSTAIMAQLADGDNRVRMIVQSDRGIYDGMNNGLAAASGRWLYFMGCDDRLKSDTALESVLAEEGEHRETGMIYGSVYVNGDVKWARDGTVYDGQFDDEKIQRKNICHQAIFYNRELLKDIGGYSLKYPLCADWDVNIKVFARYGAKFVDTIVADFNAGGASTAGSDPAFGKDFKELCRKEFGENSVV